MEAAQNDLERLMIFEHARITAEAEYAKNPTDADVCFSLPPSFSLCQLFKNQWYTNLWTLIEFICTLISLYPRNSPLV